MTSSGSALEGALLRGLRAAWARSDEIFGLVAPSAWLERPIGLRHPILFYVGHLPAFAWNQVARGVLGQGALDPDLDALFERGIDPAEPHDTPARSRAAWPSIAATLGYRDAVRDRLPALLSALRERAQAHPDDPLAEEGRVVRLVIEHECMHHETLLYMLAQCPPGRVRQRPAAIAPPEGGAGRAARPVPIAAGPVRLGVDWAAQPFAWDNELGHLDVDIPAFALDDLPVRNIDWLRFWQAAGSPEALSPAAWCRPTEGAGVGVAVRTVFGPVPFALAEGWPVQVSGQQARAYCMAQGGRLPTEAELRRAALTTPGGEGRTYPWGEDPPGPERSNTGFRAWFPRPVGSSPRGQSAWGVEELVGNGWEWTASPFAPLPGFRPWARTYPGYSADFFDGDHDVLLGGSWATADALLRPSFRNWYRRSYPYPFSSFRVAHDLLRHP